jgi:hypothetical protein
MTSQNKILHFDTIDGVNNYDNIFSGRTGGSGQNVTSFQSYNTRLSIATPINNIVSISLKTVEIPFQALNVRSTNKSNYIKYFVEYGGYSTTMEFTMKDRNYTSISPLIADVNTAFATSIATNANLTGFTIVFSVNPNDTSKLMTKANPTQLGGQLPSGHLFIYQSILSEMILGITYPQSGNTDIYQANADTYSYMYMTNNYNLQPDNYFNMNFTNVQTSPVNANGKPSTFKIPMGGSFGEVIYYSETDGSEQTLYIDRPNTTLDYLNMVITDRWGFPVYSNGSQISFTLNVEYEETY